MDNSQRQLISINEVCKRTSLSRTSINQKRASGQFPKPVSLGLKRIAFVAAEIDDWIEARIAERRAKIDKASLRTPKH